MQKFNYWSCLSIFLVLSMKLFADSIATQGWYYYDDPSQQIIQQKVINQPMQFHSSKEVLDEAQKEYNELEARAILDPTQENIKAYRDAIRLFTDKSARVSMLIATQDFQDPNAYSSKFAYNGAGLQYDLQKEREQNADIIKTVGLFYFTAQNCRYCVLEANELKRLEDNFGIRVKVISMDGSNLPQYPDPWPDNGFAANLGVKAPGALIAFDTTKNKAITVGYGYFHYDEIISRLHELFIDGTAYPNDYLQSSVTERIAK